MRIAVLTVLSAAMAVVAVKADEASASRAEEVFAQHVLPVLREKCFACHGEIQDDVRSGFNMLSRQGLLQGGESGEPAIIPGKPSDSPLYLAVRWEGYEMPPKANDRLNEEQIGYIREWIAGGAPWPDEERIAELNKDSGKKWNEAEGVTIRTSGGLADEWTHRRYNAADLWTYQPLWFDKTGRLKKSTRNPIDVLVEDRLDELGLQPAPPADRRTLIRRATFDLIGLPPDPGDVDAFLNDPAGDDEAFAKVIDRLLSSSHYGEQWGRHWLDVVRYADSSGFANDYERGNAWRYRDYVIRSFNDDKPYDRFIREQISGDEIGPENPENLIAVGYLRMGPWELTGMEVAKIARQRFLDDVVNSIGETFLGHTLRCAKCHDHKFDPVPTRDYYRIMAIFDTTQLAEREAPFLPQENLSGFDERKYLKKRQQRLQQIKKRLDEKKELQARKWAEDRGLPYVPRAEGMRRGIAPEKLPPKMAGFTVEDFGLERISTKGLQRLQWSLERYEPYALSVYNGTTPSRKSVTSPTRIPREQQSGSNLKPGRILAGGDVFSPTEEVKPGALSALNSTIPELAEIEFPESVYARRTALANWMAHPENVLTLRSIVNRIWQWHFNQSIAGNPNNFGATGKKPTHPELLDWLAVTFREQGWSVKQMHRLIMMSQAYRRSSFHPQPLKLADKDPKVETYAVFQPRRLAAEELRDSMLAVSGELNPETGGIPIRPEIDRETALQPRMVMGTFAEAWQPNPLPQQRHRRSIYVQRLRGLGIPFMEVFNQPNSDSSCERREASTVTPQVFSLFNSQQSYDRAVAFAIRLQCETHSREQAIDRAFQLAFSRSPAASERDACLNHWNEMFQRHRNLDAASSDFPAKVVRDAVEENTGERFSFLEVLDSQQDFIADLKLADVDLETRALADICLVIFNTNEFIFIY